MPELNTTRGIAILMVVLYHGLYWGERGHAFPAAPSWVFHPIALRAI